MAEKLKKIMSAVSALSVAAAVAPVIPAKAADGVRTSGFDPETVCGRIIKSKMFWRKGKTHRMKR